MKYRPSEAAARVALRAFGVPVCDVPSFQALQPGAAIPVSQGHVL